MIEAELHDGRVLEFPDGTDPAVVQATVKRMMAASQPEPEGPGAVTQFLHGANEAIFAPARWAEEGVARVVGTEKRPVSGFLKEQFYPSSAATSGQKIARSAGGMIPETLATGAALTALAPAAIPAMAARAVPGVRDMLARALMRPYETAAPATAAAGDVLGGAGAGAGQEAYRQATDAPTMGGELTAGVAGGTAAASIPAVAGVASRFGPVGMAARGVRDMALSNMSPQLLQKYPGLRDAATAQQARDRSQAMPTVAREFQQLGQPDMEMALSEARRLREAYPGFDPTTAEATGLPSLVAAQRKVQGEAHGPELDALARRRIASEQALQAGAEGSAPQVAGDASRVISGAPARRMQDVRGQMERATGDVAERALELPDQLPKADLEAAGTTLRDRMLELRGTESARMSKMADDLGLGAETWVPLKQLQARVKSVKPSQFAGPEILGPTAMEIMAAQTSKGKPATFQDIKYWREQIGDDIRTAERAGERNKARVMSRVRDQIDEFLDKDVPAKVFQGDVGLQGNYRQFREAYKRDFIDRFETGGAKAAKRIGADQRFKTADEDVAFDFFGAGDIRGARDFKRVFADDPKARDAMQAVITDSARQAAVKDGQVNRKALAKWINDHESVLAQFPESRSIFDDVERSAAAIEARRATLKARQKKIENSDFAAAASGRPDQVVDSLLADPRMANRAISVMSDGERNAFSRVMWDRALGSDGVVDPDNIRSFMQKNGAIARRVMSPEHLKSLGDLERGWRMLGAVPGPAGKASSPNAFETFEKAAGTGPLQISSRIFAVASGRTSPRMVMADLLARGKIAGTKRQAEEITKQALYDADFARELAAYVRDPSAKSATQHVRKMKAYLSAAGIEAAAPESEE